MTAKTLKESDYFIAWLLFTIIATVGGISAGVIVGTSLGMIFNRIQVQEHMILIIGVAAGYAVATTVSYLAFRLVVRHQIVKKLKIESPNPQ